MMDVGLLVSIAIMLTVPAIFVTPWPDHVVGSGVFDVSIGALFVGVIVGRLTAVAIDDPGALTSLSDLLIIRSGVEFWPGVLAGTAWIWFQARREPFSPALRLAALTPAALVAWACFEATCLLRDGCPGPASPVGLRAGGLATRMLPIGVLVAVAAIAASIALDRAHRRGAAPVQVVLAALAAVAGIRSLASFWLPRIGQQITRQHRESIAVFILAGSALVAITLRHRASAPAST